MGKRINLEEEKELMALGKALSSEIRLKILGLLQEGPLCVNEIAELLNIPASSAALHVRVLEEAELIRTELKPGIRGSMKLCIRQETSVVLDLQKKSKEQREEVISMPVGNYVDYKITPTCGMVNEEEYIDGEDEPRCFYDPRRTTAKLVWFSSGYLEYRFPNAGMQKEPVKSLDFSAELCSETADYNLDCPSDITLWINGIEAGTWTCPSDFGGRRGKLNPDWWEDKNSQYGNLKNWHIDETGTYLDGLQVSGRGIEAYALAEGPYVSVRIGIKEDAEHVGGVNIFGNCFGDYPQDLVMRLKY
ncbi:helix-turn-helix domain-containing protein [Blautia sp. HA2174]|uniref:ArsR/SmtB family transcription factor n=1 Tax=unclassified Blautia TaxID=2648079 RepID=UPI0025DB712D|nr:helix-turn-helix domain-containing protein [uncultured Blautia sp.]